VKRYPPASTRSGSNRDTENFVNRSTAVIASVTSTMASSEGKNALSSASGRPANGTTAANPTSTIVATATADAVCRAVGGSSTSHVSALSALVVAMIAPPGRSGPYAPATEATIPGVTRPPKGDARFVLPPAHLGGGVQHGADHAMNRLPNGGVTRRGRASDLPFGAPQRRLRRDDPGVLAMEGDA
jgi:hypothetical protein